MTFRKKQKVTDTEIRLWLSRAGCEEEGIELRLRMPFVIISSFETMLTVYILKNKTRKLERWLSK